MTDTMNHKVVQLMKEKDDIQTHYERQIEKLKQEKVKDVEFETHELKEKEKEL